MLIGLTRVLLWFALCSGAMMPVAALQIVAREPARYPEGLVEIDGAIWYAEMAANQISRWTSHQVTKFRLSTACGPTSVEAYGRQLLVLCHLSNAILLVDQDAKILHRQTRSGDGFALYNPNDAVRDAAGGVYFSSSGDFKYGAPVAGSIFYLHASGQISRVATGIHYANGVTYDAKRSRLIVAEHLARRVLEFAELAPGTLGPARVLVDLRERLKRMHDWRVGPDGLDIDAHGTLRVALYGVGQLLTLANGLVQVQEVPMRYLTTVLAAPPLGLVLGGTYKLNDPSLNGQVIVSDLRP